MDVCENEKFAWGTKALLAAVIGANNTGARVIIGGGDTVTAVHQLGYADEIPTLSTGGGACLHLLQGKKLPGFEALSPPDVNGLKQREDDVLEEIDPRNGKPIEKKSEDSVNTQQTVM